MKIKKFLNSVVLVFALTSAVAAASYAECRSTLFYIECTITMKNGNTATCRFKGDRLISCYN